MIVAKSAKTQVKWVATFLYGFLSTMGSMMTATARGERDWGLIVVCSVTAGLGALGVKGFNGWLDGQSEPVDPSQDPRNPGSP